VIFQDPYGVYNPFYRVDHVLTTPVSKFKLASSKALARALTEDVLQAIGLHSYKTQHRLSDHKSA
jgi:ABC-type dipeptide/oligopeptide/nickel transport system ATPase subunit